MAGNGNSANKLRVEGGGRGAAGAGSVHGPRWFQRRVALSLFFARGGGDQVLDAVFLALRCVVHLSCRSGGAPQAVFRGGEYRPIPDLTTKMMELASSRSDVSIRNLPANFVLPIR
jgi:hypothetical protein